MAVTSETGPIEYENYLIRFRISLMMVIPVIANGMVAASSSKWAEMEAFVGGSPVQDLLYYCLRICFGKAYIAILWVWNTNFSDGQILKWASKANYSI